MKIKRGFGVLLLMFVAVSVIYAGLKEYRGAVTDRDAAVQKERGHKVIAYYFHTTARCMTCRQIEAYSLQAIQSRFSEALGKGALVWRALNVEEPANAHFVGDYQLSTKSVVLVEMEDGVQRRWKTLDRVWDEIGNPEQFMRYVQTEVAEFGGRLL